MWPGFFPSTMMRSASSTASSILWVTRKMDLVGMVLLAHSSSSSLRRFSAVSTSRALKGSSMKRTSGSTTRARAKPTPLLHAAGQFLRVGAFKAVQTNRVQYFHAAVAAHIGGNAARLQWGFNIFQHREPGKECKALKNDGDIDLRAGNGLLVPVDLAGGGHGEAGQYAQHGRFAGAGWAEQGNDLSGNDGEVSGGDDLNAVLIGLRVVFLDLLGANN